MESGTTMKFYFREIFPLFYSRFFIKSIINMFLYLVDIDNKLINNLGNPIGNLWQMTWLKWKKQQISVIAL